ncbi:hypothetical protein GWI33_015747 [Rhynchophorus ferrugineus]|uniref:Uncharacterized protein n=1 Tax=Rhynchophorus ferrugineus TaxID=354439 RepID=A0A834ICM4_RHYFE|nr:hypothetical protein GWI33_015747 [Rhynchophorus ferrugineus]
MHEPLPRLSPSSSSYSFHSFCACSPLVERYRVSFPPVKTKNPPPNLANSPHRDPIPTCRCFIFFFRGRQRNGVDGNSDCCVLIRGSCRRIGGSSGRQGRFCISGLHLTLP